MPTPSRARTRAALAPRQDLVLRVSLRDIVPEIWRTVRVPREYTLAQLHRTLQLVFAWQDYHLHMFEIGERRFEAPDEEAEGESTAIRRWPRATASCIATTTAMTGSTTWSWRPWCP